MALLRVLRGTVNNVNERMPIVVQRGFFLDNLANEVVPRYFGSVLRLRIICQSWTSETVNHVNEREHLQQHEVTIECRDTCSNCWSAETNYYVCAHFVQNIEGEQSIM